MKFFIKLLRISTFILMLVTLVTGCQPSQKSVDLQAITFTPIYAPVSNNHDLTDNDVDSVKQVIVTTVAENQELQAINAQYNTDYQIDLTNIISNVNLSEEFQITIMAISSKVSNSNQIAINLTNPQNLRKVHFFDLKLVVFNQTAIRENEVQMIKNYLCESVDWQLNVGHYQLALNRDYLIDYSSIVLNANLSNGMDIPIIAHSKLLSHETSIHLILCNPIDLSKIRFVPLQFHVSNNQQLTSHEVLVIQETIKYVVKHTIMHQANNLIIGIDYHLPLDQIYENANVANGVTIRILTINKVNNFDQYLFGSNKVVINFINPI